MTDAEWRKFIDDNDGLGPAMAHKLMDRLDAANQTIAWYDKCKEAELKGVTDYLDGKTVEECPYEDDGLRDLWMSHWEMAKRDAKKDSENRMLRKALEQIRDCPYSHYVEYIKYVDAKACETLAIIDAEGGGERG